MIWVWIGLSALVAISFAVAGGIGYFIGRSNGNDTRGKGRTRR